MTVPDVTSDKLRFQFGKNWAHFLKTIDEAAIAVAEESLRSLVGLQRLDGLTFLDVGSGSGLSSLAARRLGAMVTSFDYDAQSVACTAALRDRFFPGDPRWSVAPGSVLDRHYLASLGTFDVVYSWGVLHHTGNMWEALENVAGAVRPGGRLALAIYNDQGRRSRIWRLVKQSYNALPPPLRFFVLAPAALVLWGPATLRDFAMLEPFATWRNYRRTRGMSAWRDVLDWVGGYPFEVAKPEQVFDFYRDKGFRLIRLTTCAGRIGCNEFAFLAEKQSASRQ
jgi:2-polyprenyl-6-hydroxyphenyl methylase/3-demethylubiquinone-9 3-methyltransferase